MAVVRLDHPGGRGRDRDGRWSVLGRSLVNRQSPSSSKVTKDELLAAIERARHEHSQLSVALDPVLDPRVVLNPVRDAGGGIVDFRCVDANNAAVDFFRARRHDVIGLSLQSELHGHAGSTFFEMLVDVARTGEPLNLESFAYGYSEAAAENYFHIRVDSLGEALNCAWRDVTETHELSQRYQLLSENSSDVVYQTNPNGVFEWISSSMERVLGWKPEALIGTSELELIPTEQHASIRFLRGRALEGQDVEGVETRLKTADGDLRWVAWQTSAVTDAEGNVVALVTGVRDCQVEVATRHALTALSAGSHVLIHSRDMATLLTEMCEEIVNTTGYLFAWYGRRVEDEEKSVEKIAASSAHRSYLDEVDVSWGDGPLGQGPTGWTIRTGATTIQDEFAEASNYGPWKTSAKEHGFRASIALAVRIDAEIDGALMVYAAEANAFDGQAVSVLEDLASQIGYGILRLREHEQLVQSLNDLKLLGTAIDQVADSVIMTDPEARILYANPAATRTSGYSTQEILGSNPRLFGSGLQDSNFYKEMWARLTGGRSWSGVMVNRRKSGKLYEEDVTISPVHDSDGKLSAYVGVMHDLTIEHQLAANLTREQSDRATVMDLMRSVRPSVAIEATAAAFTEAVRVLDGADAVFVLLRRDGGALQPIGSSDDLPAALLVTDPVGLGSGEAVLARAETGCWWVDLNDLESIPHRDLAEMALARGYTAVALAPIRWEAKTIGVLVIFSKDAAAPEWMDARLATFDELGFYAGVLFGARAELYQRDEAIRAELLDILEHGRFHPVFQPVVELASRTVIGYEALTRFDDNKRPDLRYAEAHEIGMGSQVEAASVVAILKAAEHLDQELWLSLNFSPLALVDGSAANVLRGANREIVIEITEHAVVERYPAVRRAVDQMDRVRLSVDDASAGYAGLCHILELRPDMVKLDITLVRDIDTDPARRALVSGMCHFASITNIHLVAEGVETDAEAATLLSLGVRFGQGYLFGRPEPAPNLRSA